MSNVDALKELYVQLGGSAADVEEVSLISDMIVKISEVATNVGGGAAASDLPSVSSADNGKVLKVVDGEWVAATIE